MKERIAEEEEEQGAALSRGYAVVGVCC